MHEWKNGSFVEVSGNIYYKNNKVEASNMQNVKEFLMRKAVKYSEYYCTDILYFFSELEEVILERFKGKSELETSFLVGIRQMGVEESYSSLWRSEETYLVIYEIILRREKLRGENEEIYVDVIKKQK